MNQQQHDPNDYPAYDPAFAPFQNQAGNTRAGVIAGIAALVMVVSLVLGVAAGARSLAGGGGGEFIPFSGVTADGQPVSSEDFEGDILVIDFWATWCPPCRASMPELIALQEKYADRGVQFIGVSGDRNPSELAAYERSEGINFPTIFQGADEILRAYNIRAFPTKIVVDRDRNVTFRGHHGDLDGHLERLLDNG